MWNVPWPNAKWGTPAFVLTVDLRLRREDATPPTEGDGRGREGEFRGRCHLSGYSGPGVVTQTGPPIVTQTGPVIVGQTGPG